MADTQHISTSKTVRKKPSPYLGVTREGIKIVRPQFSPKNFTEKELREAVSKALAKSV